MEKMVLNNRYALEQRIGVGGMAYVFEARDLVLKRKVAVKILKEQYIDDEEFVAKFEKEAQAAASLNHPNIVNVYDVGRQKMGDRILHYIVMELIVGTTLKEAIKAHGRMTSPAIAKTGRQIAMALQTAHDHDLIHRDIKPANILITRAGDIKVADFGIARIASAATVTFTNNILGTVHYISPEQAKGQLVDEKSDIYSLGIVMYEMATGKVPFDADSSVAIAMKHIQEEPIAPIDLNPNLDPGLNRIILKCIEKNPADRFQSAQDLAESLENYRDIDDTLYIPRSTMAAGPRPGTDDSYRREAVYKSRPKVSDRVEDSSGKKRGLIILMSAMAFVAALLIIFFLYERSNNKDGLVTVPALINLSENDALEALAKNKLIGNVTERRPDDKLEEGLVIEQSIMNGTRVAQGTTINLVISSGQSLVTIPDVRGQSADGASKMLTSAGFKVSETKFEYNETAAKDEVFKTDPDIGSQATFGSWVNIYVSRGPEQTSVVVPSLLNQEQNKAISLLTEAGLNPGKVTSEFSNYPAGNVIGQSIEAGTKVEKNQTVDIIVSKGKNASESSENVVGQTVQYKIKIYPPANKDTFEVTIYDIKESSEKPIFRKTYKTAELGDSEYFVATVEGKAGAELEIFFDGIAARSSAPVSPGE